MHDEEEMVGLMPQESTLPKTHQSKYKEFKENLKEMEEGLSRLNRSIYQLTKDLDEITVEKVRLELKLKNMKAEYLDKRKHSPGYCAIC